jgi:hypothetical protein
VVLTFTVTLSAKGSMIGNPIIGGIPFVSSSQSVENRAMNLSWNNLNISPYSIGYAARESNFAQFYLYKITAAGNISIFSSGSADFTDTSSIRGTITYRVSA